MAGTTAHPSDELGMDYPLDESVAILGSFPTTEEEFREDPRVSFSRTSGKWTLEADDGTEYEYDEGLRRWIPVVCIPLVFHLSPRKCEDPGIQEGSKKKKRRLKYKKM